MNNKWESMLFGIIKYVFGFKCIILWSVISGRIFFNGVEFNINVSLIFFIFYC